LSNLYSLQSKIPFNWKSSKLFYEKTVECFAIVVALAQPPSTGVLPAALTTLSMSIMRRKELRVGRWISDENGAAACSERISGRASLRQFCFGWFARSPTDRRRSAQLFGAFRNNITSLHHTKAGNFGEKCAIEVVDVS
jgi:hypothetical protein